MTTGLVAKSDNQVPMGLPQELWRTIFIHLRPQDLGCIAQVSLRWRQMVSQDESLYIVL